MDANSPISRDRWMRSDCHGRRRVRLLFQRDQWGHGNSNDHFLWSKALEVKGQYQQLPTGQTGSSVPHRAGVHIHIRFFFLKGGSIQMKYSKTSVLLLRQTSSSTQLKQGSDSQSCKKHSVYLSCPSFTRKQATALICSRSYQGPEPAVL